MTSLSADEPFSAGFVPPVGGHFDRFVAVDWSGARGARHRGISVAVANPGAAAPRLVAPPGGAWSRQAAVDFLLRLGGVPLIGLDFSFAPPCLDRGAYLPGIDTPADGPGFWAWLDSRCPDDEDLGAGSFVAGPARAHMWMGAADGRKADYVRWRRCELAFNAGGGGKAATLFDCVGAAQVAKASFAGMRALHRLSARYAIWPFEERRAEGGLVVEIYSRAMLRHAGGRGGKLRDAAALDAALAALGSRAAQLDGPVSDHQSDALVAAAALRRLGAEPRWWSPPGLTAAVARSEGWTFGIG